MNADDVRSLLESVPLEYEVATILGGLWVRLLAERECWSGSGVPGSSVRVISACLNSMEADDVNYRDFLAHLHPTDVQCLLEANDDCLTRHVLFVAFRESIIRSESLFFRNIWSFEGHWDREQAAGQRMNDFFRDLSRVYWREQKGRSVVPVLLDNEHAADPSGYAAYGLLAEMRRQSAQDVAMRIQHVGMSGNHRRLRQSAVDRYFRPMAEVLVKSDQRHLREEFLILESKHRRGDLVSELLRTVSRHSELRPAHRASLMRFLEGNLGALRRWISEHETDEASLSTEGDDSVMFNARRTVARLCSETEPPNVAGAAVGSIEWLERTVGAFIAELRAGKRPEPSLAFFGELPPSHGGSGASGRALRERADLEYQRWPNWFAPSPQCPRCWIGILRGELSWRDLLQDGIASLLGLSQRAPADTLRALITIGEVEAAAEAEHTSWCAGPAAARVVARARSLVEQKQEREEAASALEQRLRAVGELGGSMVAEDVDRLENALIEALDTNLNDSSRDAALGRLDEIETEVEELESRATMIGEARTRRSSELVGWLKRAGESVTNEVTLEELERQVAALRDRYQSKRLHIEALDRLLTADVPIVLRTAAQAIRKRQDVPENWPRDEASEWVTLLVDNVVEVMQPWWQVLAQLDASDPTHRRIGRVASILAAALPEEVDSAIREEYDRCRILNALSGDRKTLHPLSVIEELATAENPKASPTAESERGAVGDNSQTVATVATPASAGVDGTRWLRNVDVPAGTGQSVQDAHRAFVREEYKEAQKLAAAAWKWAQHNASEQAGPLSAIFLWSTVMSHSEAVDAEMALASALSYSAELMARNRDLDATRFLGWLFRIVGGGRWDQQGTRPEAIARAIVELDAKEPGAPEREQFRRIIAATAKKDWVRILWEGVRGLKDGTAKARSSLLMLMFRFDEMDALSTLLERADSEYVKYLRAFVALAKRAEVDQSPKLRAAVQQSIGNLRRVKERPFREFADRLTAGMPFAKAHVKVDVMETLEPVKERQCYRMVVTVTPDESDPPLTLQLTVESDGDGTDFAPAGAAAATQELTTGDVLLDQREVEFLIKRTRQNPTHVALRVNGETASGQRIEQTRRFPVTTIDDGTFEPLAVEDLLDIYEGVDGRPVTGRAFVGREKELAVLERTFRRNTPGIVVVYGARRLGKTSLLRECRRRVCATYAPSRRTICLAVAVDEINFAGTKRAFLDKCLRDICSQTLRHPQNGRLRDFLSVPERMLAECGQFDDTIDASFLAKLRTYLRRLKDLAGGRFERVILIFDEFDKLLEEYRTQREDVEELTNQLRHAGTEDDDIGILLAGSELMKRFVGQPRNALYGSATHIELQCFDSSEDRGAAREIVAPQRLMGRRVFRTLPATSLPPTGFLAILEV